MQKVKDENKVKRPVAGGFSQFLAQNRSSLMSEVTDTGKRKAVEVIQLASKRWRSMSADEKLPYEESYQTRMAEYRAAKKQKPVRAVKKKICTDPDQVIRSLRFWSCSDIQKVSQACTDTLVKRAEPRKRKQSEIASKEKDK